MSRGIIRNYLGQGDPKRASRTARQIRDAISALKQSGRYDEMVDEAIRKFPPPVDKSVKPSKSRAAVKTKPATRRPRILDEQCANLFPNDHQFHAFRDAVTTPAAQKVIPVENQYKLAQEIMSDSKNEFRQK
jgi:hypothetical protein